MNRRKRRLLSLLLTLALLIPAVTVTGQITQAKKAIKLKQKEIYVEIGGKTKIVVKNAPKAAKVTYKLNKKGIVTVSKKGVVKAKKEGTVKVTVIVKKAKKTLKKLSCKVYVMPQMGPDPTPTPGYTPDIKPGFAGDRTAKISKAFSSQARDFSVELFKKSVEKDVKDGKNALISPHSVLTDMMMATNGAGTDTLDELSKVMCGDIGFTDFRQELCNLNARVILSYDVIFHIANSVWIRDDAERLQVKQSFIDDCAKYFNAESFTVPFDQAMVDKVNGWVNENTRGMIPKLMEQVPEDEDVMHLINALAFEAAWAQPYEDYAVSKDETFTDAKGTKQKATMLNETMHGYHFDDKAVGFEKEYKGFDYSFVTILPNEDVGVEEYLKGLDGEGFKKFMDSSDGYCIVNTKLPEFSYDYSTNLNQPLKDMGIKKAFQEDADFTNMADTKTGELFIGNVTHKTHIELDKNGTKAAAVTDIGMKDAASVDPDQLKRIDIFLDRPFIYAIVQRDTGIPIFMGVVNSLEK